MNDEPARWGDPDCVVLDIGGSSGALVICADPGDEGREVEISLGSAPARRTHAALRARRVSRGRVVAACFPSLAAGEYLVWPVDGGDPHRSRWSAARWSPSSLRWIQRRISACISRR